LAKVGVCVDRQGFSYVADDKTGSERVEKYEDEGNKVLTFSISGGPLNIDVDDQGFIYVLYAANIEKYDDEGNKVLTITL